VFAGEEGEVDDVVRSIISLLMSSKAKKEKEGKDNPLKPKRNQKEKGQTP
jgi:hypothetical protein